MGKAAWHEHVLTATSSGCWPSHHSHHGHNQPLISVGSVSAQMATLRGTIVFHQLQPCTFTVPKSCCACLLLSMRSLCQAANKAQALNCVASNAPWLPHGQLVATCWTDRCPSAGFVPSQKEMALCGIRLTLTNMFWTTSIGTTLGTTAEHLHGTGACAGHACAEDNRRTRMFFLAVNLGAELYAESHLTVQNEKKLLEGPTLWASSIKQVQSNCQCCRFGPLTFSASTLPDIDWWLPPRHQKACLSDGRFGT